MTAADDFKIDYSAAAIDALNRVQQELVTKEIEQKVKLEQENGKKTVKAERLRSIGGGRNESTKQFGHETNRSTIGQQR